MTLELRMNNLYAAAVAAFDKPLNEYYSVPGKYILNRRSTNEFILIVRRDFNLCFQFKELPTEIGHYISSYLTQNIRIVFQLTYTAVFVPPKWSILHEDTHRPFLHKCITLHNKMYEDSWSPAFTLVGDMLHLIVVLLPLLRRKN